MQINSVNSYTNFKSGSNESDWSLVPAVIPGFHQLLNGRVKEGCLFLGADIGLGAAAYLLDKSVKKDMVDGFVGLVGKDNELKQKSINSLKSKKYGYPLIVAGVVILELFNLYDVFKHKKN